MRQYRSFVLAIQVILALQHLYGGFERHAQPASLTGRAGAGVALASDAHLWLNPAVHAGFARRSVTMFSMPSPFQLPQLTTHGAAVADTIAGFGLAAGFLRFGSTLYREQSVTAAVARSVEDNVSVGLAFHLSHIAVQDYGSAFAVQWDAGFRFRLSSVVSLGASVHNITGAHFGEADDIPRLFLFGTALHLPEGILLAADLVKDVRYPLFVRIGAEVPLHPSFSLRAGMDSSADRLTGGLSVTVSPFRAEYAIGIHPALGLQHTFGLRFE
ncbi:MAG: hypothetical protein HUU02_12540 [Bacteroidetes bacterium]|nr:hypothetical protein [Bacteroidota bacterium]